MTPTILENIRPGEGEAILEEMREERWEAKLENRK
jgi:hypothetical protein